mmetsp:Transcript_38487/g.123697  ORF Transcript_38487/g.123697 Transcript_38487/m.123697 type:complete len:210 (+) Transcript_38487:595-1224(+)
MSSHARSSRSPSKFHALAIEPSPLIKIATGDHGCSPLPVTRTIRLQVLLARAASMMCRTPSKLTRFACVASDVSSTHGRRSVSWVVLDAPCIARQAEHPRSNSMTLSRLVTSPGTIVTPGMAASHAATSSDVASGASLGRAAEKSWRNRQRTGYPCSTNCCTARLPSLPVEPVTATGALACALAAHADEHSTANTNACGSSASMLGIQF